ncbi:hypothetical protein J3F84DRAFT_24143 [Trichoderma pleuroticola]
MTQWMRAEGNVWVPFFFLFRFCFSLTTITNSPLKHNSSAHHFLFFSLYPELASLLGLGFVAFGICSQLHRNGCEHEKESCKEFLFNFFFCLLVLSHYDGKILQDMNLDGVVYYQARRFTQ